INLLPSSLFNPLSSAILHKSSTVTESKYSFSLFPASFHTIRVTHSVILSQGCFESSGSTQRTGLRPLSVILTISPTVISSGLLAKKYPPVGPLLLPTIPPRLSFWKICSRYRGDIPCLLDISF